MLLQFTVGNFLSFRERATLSLLVPDEAAQDPRFVTSAGRRATRVVAIYGANASGKSNLVRALACARNLVLAGTRAGTLIDVQPFKLDPDSEREPSSFEFELALEGAVYSYGFVVRPSEVVEEWLYETRDGVERTLFTREYDPAAPAAPRIDASALATSEERRQFLKFVADGTRANQLFLAEARDRNVVELTPIALWFQRLHLVPPQYELSGLASAFEKDQGLREFVERFLRESGTGVSSIEITPGNGEHSAGVASGESSATDAEHDDAHRLRFRHETRAGHSTPFRLEEESEGTRRLLTLAPRASRLRATDLPQLFVADELDRSLHPLLARFYIETFQATPTDNTSQLIFTTHDTNILDLGLVSRYSIWFTEKDHAGASSLYSLADFKPEQIDALGGAVERGYLVGRFGGIPFLGDPKRLGWVLPP